MTGFALSPFVGGVREILFDIFPRFNTTLGLKVNRCLEMLLPFGAFLVENRGWIYGECSLFTIRAVLSGGYICLGKFLVA